MDMIIVLAAILALGAIIFSLAALGMVIESVQQTRLMTHRLAEQLRRLDDFKARPLEPHVSGDRLDKMADEVQRISRSKPTNITPIC